MPESDQAKKVFNRILKKSHLLDCKQNGQGDPTSFYPNIFDRYNRGTYVTTSEIEIVGNYLDGKTENFKCW